MLSAPQIEFRDALRKFLTQESTGEVVRRSFEDGPDQNFMQKLQDFGLREYFATSRTDGGGGGRELGVVAEEAGRVLLPSPLLDELLAGPWFLGRALEASDREHLVGQLQSLGFSTLADTVQEGEARGSIAPLSAKNSAQCAVVRGAPGRISGEARFVAALPGAQYLIVSAHDGERLVLALVPLDDREKRGVRSEPESSLDRTIQRERIRLDASPCIVLPEAVADKLRIAEAIVRANELAGMGSRVVHMTAEYLKTRKQFGVAIGSFQAVQQKIADAYLASEATSALSGFAAWALDSSPTQIQFSARAALHFALENLPQVVESAVQLHGGIGFTWEYDLHLILRRVKMFEAIYRFTADEERVLLRVADAG
jgi:acyl-CoA dehydrogenase